MKKHGVIFSIDVMRTRRGVSWRVLAWRGKRGIAIFVMRVIATV